MCLKRKKPVVKKSTFNQQYDHTQYYKMIMSQLARMPSISNPSLDSLYVPETIQIDDEVDKSPSVLMSDNLRHQIYEKFLKENGLTKDDVSLDCIQPLCPIYQLLEEDRFSIAKSYIKNVTTLDPNFMERFEICAEKNPIYCMENEKHNMQYRAFLHTLYVIKLKYLTFEAIRTGNYDKMTELINLVTLSHLIMGVNITDFRDFMLGHLKYLLTFNLIKEEQLGNFIYYGELSGRLYTKFVLHNMQAQSEKSIMHSDNSRRRNYRCMKLWKVLVKNLTAQIAEDIKKLDKYSYEEADTGDPKHAEDVNENCCLIKMLKKGYKYKKPKNLDFRQLTAARFSVHPKKSMK